MSAAHVGVLLVALLFTSSPVRGQDGCPPQLTFESVNCRLDALSEQTRAALDAGALADRLLAELRRAQANKEQAEQRCAEGDTRRARSALRSVIRQMIGFRHALGAHGAREVVPDDVRGPLRDTADRLRRDVRLLRKDVECPVTGVTTTSTTQPPTTTTIARVEPTPFLVKDISPGPTSTFVSDADRLGPSIAGTLFFTGQTGLLKTDGTALGTVLLKHISAYQLTSVNGTLFFQGYEPDHGTELWKSDGTSAGTILLADIIPGSESGFPGPLGGAGTSLFFSVDDGEHGRELWVSDGTVGGTRLVKDIDPRAPEPSPSFFGSSYPFDLTNVNGTLFFSADDGVHGRELWRSDGTEAGTLLVKDIAPGYFDGVPLSPDTWLTLAELFF